ncbi:MAG: DNA methyltransferase [Chloroflexi bacterium]|nr:DNA methyltransferase [Chloroflexota bacterium]
MRAFLQQPLPGFNANVLLPRSALGNGSNSVEEQDRRIHEWYRFVLSFPPHLVRRYLGEFNLGPDAVILDPFCGTGTTLVEAKLGHFQSIGVEAHPFSHFVSSAKVNWNIDPHELLRTAKDIADSLLATFEAQGINDNLPFQGNLQSLDLPQLEPSRQKLLIKDSISPLPLRKTLALFSRIEAYGSTPYYPHLKLALAKALVFSISNLRFGPEVGIGKVKDDAPVVLPWLHEVHAIADDLVSLAQRDSYPQSVVYLNDSRAIDIFLPRQSVDAVITSPPYPNEKDYTRTTRLESVLLGFIKSQKELRTYKRELMRSNTRGVYKADTDDLWIQDFPEILQLAEAIESRRKELGKTSGFERLYSRVTKLYFGGMARHLTSLRPVLKPGAKLAYVVGDQASYLRIMIRTGALLADIAARIGYQVERIDLFRTRFATATQEELREEVLILTWPGELD